MIVFFMLQERFYDNVHMLQERFYDNVPYVAG